MKSYVTCSCRYFDMLRDIGASNKASTLFLPHSPAVLGDISSQIRNAFLEGNAAAASHSKSN